MYNYATFQIYSILYTIPILYRKIFEALLCYYIVNIDILKLGMVRFLEERGAIYEKCPEYILKNKMKQEKTCFSL
jgi:hypothetical protein